MQPNLASDRTTELQKFGVGGRVHLFINLASFPSHYIVIVVTEDGFKYALINTRPEVVDKRARVVIADLGWLDPEKLGLGPVPNECVSALGRSLGSVVNFHGIVSLFDQTFSERSTRLAGAFQSSLFTIIC